MTTGMPPDPLPALTSLQTVSLWARTGMGTWISVGVISSIVALAIFGALSFAAYLFTDETFTPLYGSGYDKPQQTEEGTVPAGGILHTNPTKCASEDVLVQGSYNWVKIEPSPASKAGEPSVPSVVHKGCRTPRFANSVPADLTPGVWELDGQEVAISPTGEKQYKHWTSTRFTVTAAAP